MNRLRTFAGRCAFRVARTRLAGAAVGWGFAHMAWSLPLERLMETEHVVAFRHPRPAYPVHILIVPKRQIAGLLDLTSTDAALVHDIIEVAPRLVRQLGLAERGYRLLVNGGAHQDVRQLHFQLIAGDSLPADLDAPDFEG